MNKIRIFVIVAVLLIGGITLTVSGISDMIKVNGYIPDFNSESIADIQKGDMACGYIYMIHGCYAGETTTNTTMGIETSSYTSREYFIMQPINDTDLNNDMFVSVSVSDEDDRQLMYDIYNALCEYYDGNENVQFPEMGFIVRAQPMDEELMGYMLDWFEQSEYFEGGREEARRHIIPYDLVKYDPKSAQISLIVGLIMIGAVIVIAAVLLHIHKKNTTASDDTVPQDFTGYKQNGVPAQGDNIVTDNAEVPQSGSYPLRTENAAAPENSFAESSYAPSPAPGAGLSQPPDPEEFFAKPVREHKPAAPKPAAKAPETPKPAPAPVNYENEINTDSLDTDKALTEQEQEVAAHKKPVEGSEGILTETLDTDKALTEQEQAVAANKKPIEGSEGILTETLDTDKALTEQEQEVAAHKKPIEGSEEIDTSSLDMSELGYFDTSAAEDNSDEIFDFTNDIDYDVGDGSDIEVT